MILQVCGWKFLPIVELEQWSRDTRDLSRSGGTGLVGFFCRILNEDWWTLVAHSKYEGDDSCCERRSERGREGEIEDLYAAAGEGSRQELRIR